MVYPIRRCKLCLMKLDLYVSDRDIKYSSFLHVSEQTLRLDPDYPGYYEYCPNLSAFGYVTALTVLNSFSYESNE